jgi:hypothetical protein
MNSTYLSDGYEKTLDKVTNGVAFEGAKATLAGKNEEQMAKKFYQPNVEREILELIKGNVPGAKKWGNKLNAIIALATAAKVYQEGEAEVRNEPTGC